MCWWKQRVSPAATSSAGAGACGDAGRADRPWRLRRGEKLSQLRRRGSECQVDPELQDLALAMHQAGKPLGYMRAPAMLKIFAFPLRMTIGTDLDTADGGRDGAEHVPCPSTTSWMKNNKVVTTPAYAGGGRAKPPPELKLVARVLALSA